MTIVIDTCVVHAASDSDKETPGVCREFLQFIRLSAIPASVCRELFDEWREHKSKFSHAWIASMFSRKLIDFVETFSEKSVCIDKAIRRLPAAEKEIAMKDSHLLKIAVDRKYIVVSLEKKCRRAFHKAAPFCEEIGRVTWALPDDPELQSVAGGSQKGRDALRLANA